MSIKGLNDGIGNGASKKVFQCFLIGLLSIELLRLGGFGPAVTTLVQAVLTKSMEMGKGELLPGKGKRSPGNHVLDVMPQIDIERDQQYI